MAKLKVTPTVYEPFYVLDGGLGQRGRMINISGSLAREILQFQKTIDDVQALLAAYYDGRHNSETETVKMMLERVNAAHNRRLD